MSMFGRGIAMAITVAIDAAIVIAMAPDYNGAANVFWILLTVKAWIFVLLYGFRSRWWITRGGRGIMRLVSCIAAIGTLSTFTIFLGDYPGRPFVRLGLIALVALAMMDLLLTLVAAQQDDSDIAP
ncbi:putative phage holin [Nocardia nova]